MLFWHGELHRGGSPSQRLSVRSRPLPRETFGLAALEALAAGKAVLATRVGGMAQFLAEVCDRLRDTCVPPVTLAAPTVEAARRGSSRASGGGGRGRGRSRRPVPGSARLLLGRAARRYARVLAAP